MNIENIIHALNANDLDYDEEFNHLIARGYDGNECQKLSGEIVDLLGEIVRNGVNGGFNRSMSGAVKDLTKIACKLSKKGAEKNIAMFRRSKLAIEHDIRYPEARDSGLSIKKPVYSAIDTSAQAARVFIEADGVNDRTPILEKSIELLHELRDRVDDVLDDCSQSALDCASKVLKNIVKWRDDTSKRMYSQDDIENLQAAIACAEEWKTLSKAVRPRDKVTKDDLNACIKVDFNLDRIGRIAASEKVVRNIRMLRENIDRYRETKENQYSTELLEAELISVRGEGEKLKNQKEELLQLVLNGKLSKQDLALRMKSIEKNVSALIKRENQIAKDIDRREADRNIYLKTLRNVEEIYFSVKRYEDGMDPGMLSTIAGKLDFNALFAVLSDNASKKDLDALENLLSVVHAIEINATSAQIDFNRGVEEIEAEYDARRDELYEEETTEDVSRLEAEGDEYIAKLMKEFGPHEEEEESDPVRTRVDPDNDK